MTEFTDGKEHNLTCDECGRKLYYDDEFDCGLCHDCMEDDIPWGADDAEDDG